MFNKKDIDNIKNIITKKGYCDVTKLFKDNAVIVIKDHLQKYSMDIQGYSLFHLKEEAKERVYNPNYKTFSYGIFTLAECQEICEICKGWSKIIIDVKEMTEEEIRPIEERLYKGVFDYRIYQYKHIEFRIIDCNCSIKLLNYTTGNNIQFMWIMPAGVVNWTKKIINNSSILNHIEEYKKRGKTDNFYSGRLCILVRKDQYE
jgi:hypothetical protein